jgi:hypothetical protein
MKPTDTSEKSLESIIVATQPDTYEALGIDKEGPISGQGALRQQSGALDFRSAPLREIE